MPENYTDQWPMSASVPVPAYSRNVDGTISDATSKRSAEAVVKNMSVPPPKEARLGDDGSSGSPLFSEAKLQDALGKPGEIEIAMLHSLEDFSAFGGTTNESEGRKNTSTRELKSPPNVPDAIVLNDFGYSPVHHSIGEEHMVVSFAATGPSSATATSVPANTSGHHEQLSDDSTALLPLRALGDRGDAIGRF
eukprot:scaffold7789_cov87-Amphora_coffeaeformis.AAC.1